MLINDKSPLVVLADMLDIVTCAKDGRQRVAVLRFLSSQSLISSELAERVGVNRASMSRTLTALRMKGLVNSVKGGSRTVSYSITSKGRSVLREIDHG